MDSRIRTYRTRHSGNRKYGNRKIQIDGYTFDSVKEGNRYIELKYLLAAGKIKDLELQVQYELQPAFRDSKGKWIRPIYYRADFVYFDIERDRKIIEDVKGFRTEGYKLKKKMMAYKGLEIEEV